MSEDSIPAAAETASAESPAPAKSRRVSNPRPKKTAKKAAAESTPESKAAEPIAAAAEAPVVPTPAPVREEAPVRHESPAREEREEREEGGHRTPWAEPETIQGETGTQGGKRKRRRKKKGGANGIAGAQHGEAQGPRPQTPSAENAPAQPQQAPRPAQPQPQQAPRVPLDLEEVSKKAWKIFLSEVSEEGLALIGDNDARDLTRRSFRLAEIFLEEKARRTR